MESPRKFNDCYFYYYSTCTKGDNCVFRHEPSALGCETMCSAWQQGKCLDKRCKLRHMELRKNRKQIPCYWETQPGGCRKKHCPFMHKNPEARTDGIAPSQPGLAMPTQPNSSEPLCVEQSSLGGVGPTHAHAHPPAPGVAPAPAPAPVPLLWQPQRQVVLDSAILGVLPASSDLLGGGRRVLPPHHPHHPHHPHPHDAAPNPYAPLPVDPLVVNFEEESDNESAPSSTPTKNGIPDDEAGGARSKSQELLLLERIQAEAAAYYSYDSLPPAEPPKDRKIVRNNLTNKYDRLSLDEIAGKKESDERRSSLDFKVLSLDEIRAKKKSDIIIHSTPITLNLSRKRKLSTQEVNTTSGNKIIKVVRSNSIVYKKVDPNASAAPNVSKVEQKPNESIESRKRTLSEISDIYDIQEDELVDNVYEFKRIKIAEQTSKPRLIRNRLTDKSSTEAREDIDTSNKIDNDSDSEVQIVSVEISDTNIDLSISEVIDVDSATVDTIDVVDLSDDSDENEVTISGLDIDFGKNVPDVVASCHKKVDGAGKDVLKDIDAILDDDL